MTMGGAEFSGRTIDPQTSRVASAAGRLRSSRVTGEVPGGTNFSGKPLIRQRRKEKSLRRDHCLSNITTL
jgi:hypothetical protein